MARSELIIISGHAGSPFFEVQGARGVVDRVSTSDDQRRNAKKEPRPFGLCPEVGASCVAALANGTTIPGARRLAQDLDGADFRRQHGHE